MLSASSGRELSSSSQSTTMATARPRQRTGARWEEHRAPWGISRSNGEAGAKTPRPRRQRNGKHDKGSKRREGEEKGGRSTPPSSPATQPKRRGARGRRGGGARAGAGGPRLPPGAKRPRGQPPDGGAAVRRPAGLQSQCPSAGCRHPGPGVWQTCGPGGHPLYTDPSRGEPQESPSCA